MPDCIPAEDGKIKLAGIGCCENCLRVTAELSGFVQDSDACGACADGSSQCQMNVSSSALDDDMGTSDCCPNPESSCDEGFYGSLGCSFTSCNFDGAYHCGNLVCAASTGPIDVGAQVICGTGPTMYKFDDCSGGTSPPCYVCGSEDDCPPDCADDTDCYTGICVGGKCGSLFACDPYGVCHDPTGSPPCDGEHCIGSECYGDCGCASDSCPDYPDFTNNAFAVNAYIHKVEADDPFIDPDIFPTAGYYVSLWVLFQLGCGIGFQVRRDFENNGIIFFISALASNPSGTTHTFTFDDPDFGVNSCGLEGISYSVTIKLGIIA